MSDKYTLPEQPTGSAGAAAAAMSVGAMPAATPAAESTAQPTMRIKIYSPFRVYFDEPGYSLSALNATGPFDILPRHHNFMTLLSPCEMVVRGPRGTQKVRISGGLMHVKSDYVTVFLDI